MERLGKHLCVARRVRIGVEGDSGEARNEHDLQIRVDFCRAPRQFDAVHFRHDNIGQQKGERLFLQSFIGTRAVVEVRHVITGFFQRLDEEAAHIIVIFS